MPGPRGDTRPTIARTSYDSCARSRPAPARNRRHGRDRLGLGERMQPVRFHLPPGREQDEEQDRELIEQDDRQPGERQAEEAHPLVALGNDDGEPPASHARVHEQEHEDHHAPITVPVVLPAFRDEGVQKREAVKTQARRDQEDHELDRCAEAGDAEGQADQQERQGGRRTADTRGPARRRRSRTSARWASSARRDGSRGCPTPGAVDTDALTWDEPMMIRMHGLEPNSSQTAAPPLTNMSSSYPAQAMQRHSTTMITSADRNACRPEPRSHVLDEDRILEPLAEDHPSSSRKLPRTQL